MQEYEIGLPDQCVFRAYVAARRCRGRILLDEVEILITDRDDAIVVPGIHHAAVFDCEGQVAWQLERAENCLDALERAALHQQVIERFVSRIRRRHVVNLDPAALHSRGGGGGGLRLCDGECGHQREGKTGEEPNQHG
jgi:hypothetical protein